MISQDSGEDSIRCKITSTTGTMRTYLHTSMNKLCCSPSNSPLPSNQICFPSKSPLIVHLGLFRNGTFVTMIIRNDNELGVIMITRKLFQNILKDFMYNVW